MSENQQSTLNREIIYCTRCKLKEAEITCAMCDPFKYFCNHCSETVHSNQSKKFHVRRKLKEKLENSYSEKGDYLKSSSSSYYKNNESLNKEKPQNSKTELKKVFDKFDQNYNNRLYNSEREHFNYDTKETERTRSRNNFYNSEKNMQFNNNNSGLVENDVAEFSGISNKVRNFEVNSMRNDNDNVIVNNNNSLQEEYVEQRNLRTRENPRRFYNPRSLSKERLSKSPKIFDTNISNENNSQNVSSNYINNLKVKI